MARQKVKHLTTFRTDYEAALEKLTGEDKFEIGELLLVKKRDEERIVMRSGSEEASGLVEFIPKNITEALIDDRMKDISDDIIEKVISGITPEIKEIIISELGEINGGTY